MRTIFFSSSMLAVLLASGCGAGHAVAGLARGDLGCQQVRLRKVAKGKLSAAGCGRAALYERQCSRGVGCTWTRHDPGSAPVATTATASPSSNPPTQILGSADYGPSSQSRFAAAPAPETAAIRTPIVQSRKTVASPAVHVAAENVAALEQRAMRLRQAGKVDEATLLLRETLKFYERTLGANDTQVATRKRFLADLLLATGDHAEAKALLQQALRVFERAPGEQGLDLARALNGLAQLLAHDGKLAEAEPLHRRALAMRERALGPDHPDVAVSLNNLADALTKRGNYRAAEPLYLRALAIQERALGPNHPAVAMTASNYAGLLAEQAELSRAEALYRRALQIMESALGPDRLEVATALQNLGSLLQIKGELDAAEPLLRRALAICERALAPNHPALAPIVHTLAAVRDGRGDYVEAELLSRRALQLLEGALGPDHLELIKPQINLARLLELRGDYAGAERLLRHASELAERKLGRDHPESATIQNNLASVLTAKGDYAQAKSLLERTLAIREKGLPTDHPDRATTLNNLAMLHEAHGDYAAANALYLRAQRTWESRLGREHVLIATNLNNLGLLRFRQADFAGAQPLFDRALAIWTKALGPEHPEVATVLSNIGLLRHAQHDYAGAESSFRRAQTIFERAHGPNHPKVASVLDNLGSLLADEGDEVTAEQLHRRALAIREHALGADHPELATVVNNLAALMHARRDYAAAELLYARALSIHAKNFGPASPESASLHANLSLLYLDTGRIDKAVTQAQSATQVEEKLLLNVFPTMVERQRQAFARSLTETVELAVATHLQFAEADPAARALAMTTLLQRKGRVLEAGTDMTRRLRARLGGPEQEKLAQLQAVRSELSTRTLHGRLEHEESEAHLATLRALEQKVEQLEAELSEYDALRRPAKRSVTMQDIACTLGPGQALVELINYRTLNVRPAAGERWGAAHYAVYVLHADGRVGVRDLGEASAIDALVSALRTSLGEQRADERAVARKLDALVMEPTRALLGDVRDVYVSPDGALNLIPFAALVDASQRYLAETMQVTYVTSGRDLLRQHRVSPARSPALALVAPDYQLHVEPPPASTPRTATDRAVAARSAELAQLRFSPLPGTLREGEALKNVVRGAQVLSGRAASEPALGAVHGPRVLHIATHGFFLDEPPQESARTRGITFVPPDTDAATASRPEDPLLRAGLALAGANRGPSASGADGVLTAMEMTDLDLWGTRLVTLSACETGLGKVSGGEGVYGLRRALVLAGAESSLVSLWKVADEETVALMRDYYAKLEQGVGRSAALRDVQVAQIQRGMHPYFWAAFIASGDPRPLQTN